MNIMNKKVLIIVFTIMLFIGIGALVYFNTNKSNEIKYDEEKITLVSEEIEDECTEEYIQEQTKPVVYEEEKISANAQLVLKKF